MLRPMIPTCGLFTSSCYRWIIASTLFCLSRSWSCWSWPGTDASSSPLARPAPQASRTRWCGTRFTTRRNLAPTWPATATPTPTTWTTSWQSCRPRGSARTTWRTDIQLSKQEHNPSCPAVSQSVGTLHDGPTCSGQLFTPHKQKRPAEVKEREQRTLNKRHGYDQCFDLHNLRFPCCLLIHALSMFCFWQIFRGLKNVKTSWAFCLDVSSCR